MAETSDYLTIRGTVARAKQEGIPLSEYTLRSWVKRDAVKYVHLGDAGVGKARKVLLYWPNVLDHLQGNS